MLSSSWTTIFLAHLWRRLKLVFVMQQISGLTLAMAAFVGGKNSTQPLGSSTYQSQAKLVNQPQHAQVEPPLANKTSDQSLIFDSGQIWINVSFIKNQLASGNFILVVALASCFVVLYFICLVAHLKGCNFTNRNKRDLKRPFGGQSQSSVISEPFNLRMAPATRTRLELMFRRKGNRHAKVRDNRQAAGCHRPKLTEQDASHGRHNDYSCCGSTGCIGYQEDQLLPSYCTLKMVRALRRASYLYGRKSSYTNCLKVIPESELECLPSDTGTGFRNNPSQSDSNDYVTCDQFDVLVRDAMSQSCSHSFGRPAEDTIATTTTKTLLSRPVDCDSETLNKVSRESILVHGRGSNQIVVHHDGYSRPEENDQREMLSPSRIRQPIC